METEHERDNEKRLLQNFRNVLHDTRWSALPSSTDARVFDSNLRASGYWNVVSRRYERDDSATYTPPFHPTYIAAERGERHHRASCQGDDHAEECCPEFPEQRREGAYSEDAVRKTRRLRPFAKVLACADDHTLRKFMLYASVHMVNARLLPPSSRATHELLDHVVARPSVQLALLVCMQHYFI